MIVFDVGGLSVETNAVFGRPRSEPLPEWILFSTNPHQGEVPLEVDEVRALVSALNTWLEARSVAP